MENVNILIYLKSRKNNKGEHPIYLRLTVDGMRKETSLNLSISASKWDKSKQNGRGRKEEIKTLNNDLNSVKADLNRSHQEMKFNDEDITAETLMNKYLGKDNEKRYLVKIIKEENIRIKNFVKEGTYRKYHALLNHVEQFVKYKYKASEINIIRLDYEFVDDFDYYLRTVKNIGNNTTVRYLKTLRKTINSALKKDWIKKDPFIDYKVKLDKVKIDPLTEEEVRIIREKELPIKRLDQIRDLFLFVCDTGLSYSDLAKLSNKHIVIGIDGNKWIKINRSKTGELSTIPIMPHAAKLLEKYKSNNDCINKGVLLPVISNERYNAYLKEIGTLCGISKNLTSHLARHTCGTLLANKLVSRESIGKILGQSDWRSTQHYCKTTDVRVSLEMNKLIVPKTSNDKSKKAI